MHCSEARQELQLYIDRRLTLARTRALEAHISRCANCRQELALLELVSHHLDMVPSVAEPEGMHAQIMQRIAISAPRRIAQPFFPWRPSLAEWIAAILLATVATLGSILEQPSLRAMLPFANGHDSLSITFMNLVHTVLSMNGSTLTLVLWIIGTVLGICITLAFAGTEVRSRWFKAMMDRLPVR
ncbi:MAG TPA: zf-HC2 domain-containing protein [Ktedonobacteraceae bacterium]|nr:zf-HC2 domain-containing protein [Ktedonobacteraceae bacterium]